MYSSTYIRIWNVSQYVLGTLVVSVGLVGSGLLFGFILTERLPSVEWWLLLGASWMLELAAAAISLFNLLDGSLPPIRWVAPIATLGALVLAYGTYRYWPA